MKRKISLLLLVLAIALSSSATINSLTGTTSRNVSYSYGNYGVHPLGITDSYGNDSVYRIEFTGKEINRKFKFDKGFFNRAGYNCLEELHFVGLYLDYIYVIPEDETQNMYFTYNVVLSCDGEVVATTTNRRMTVKPSARRPLENRYSVTQMVYFDNYNGYHAADLDKEYDLEINLVTENVAKLSCYLQQNNYNNVLSQTITCDGEDVTPSMTVDSHEIMVYNRATFEVSLTTSKVQADGTETCVAQPNGYPAVALYDVNTQEWVKPNQMNGTTTVKSSDKTWVRIDYPYTNDYGYPWLETFENVSSSKYTYKAIYDGINPTHTYVAGVSSLTAGYKYAVFTFDKGKIRDLDFTQEIAKVVPEDVDVNTAIMNWLTISAVLTTGDDRRIVTAIDDVDTQAQVVETTYYNISGVPSTEPYDGFNVKVDRYSNGKTVSTKMIR